MISGIHVDVKENYSQTNLCSLVSTRYLVCVMILKWRDSCTFFKKRMFCHLQTVIDNGLSTGLMLQGNWQVHLTSQPKESCRYIAKLLLCILNAGDIGMSLSDWKI